MGKMNCVDFLQARIEKIDVNFVNPKKINVNEIGKPTNMANNITPTNINPRMAGSINSASIIYYLLAIFLLWQPSNF